jgi:hypothetical protein
MTERILKVSVPGISLILHDRNYEITSTCTFDSDEQAKKKPGEKQRDKPPENRSNMFFLPDSSRDARIKIPSVENPDATSKAVDIPEHPSAPKHIYNAKPVPGQRTH